VPGYSEGQLVSVCVSTEWAVLLFLLEERERGASRRTTFGSSSS